MAEPLAHPAGAAPRAVVILNSGAGAGASRPSPRELGEAMASRGIESIVQRPEDAGAVTAAVREAVDSGAGLVVAAGGDGTIGTVAGVLAGTGVRLGVLPFGTRNHFAADLGIGPGLEESLDVLAAGRTRAVDVGELNGTVFVNNSSLGLYPRLVLERRRQRHLFGRGRGAAFAWAALVAFRRYSFFEVRIVSDAAASVLHTPFVFVGNNGYETHGLRIGRRRRLDEGCLDVCVPHRTGRLGLLRIAARALVRGLGGAPDLSSFRATEVEIALRRPRAIVAVDGELLPVECPLRFRIRPGALRVVVPG